jgi:hypothetical protein
MKESLDETAAKALSGGIRLSLPADRTLAAGLGNIARGNLTADDLARMGAAADRASRDPGKEQSWRSVDGRRGGRVLMAKADAAQGHRCGWFYVEVEVEGAVDSAGPQRGCSLSGRWSPAN